MNKKFDTVEITPTATGVKVRAVLAAIMFDDGPFIHIRCPSLAIGTQGDNIKEAEAMILEATACFLELVIDENLFKSQLEFNGFAKQIDGDKIVYKYQVPPSAKQYSNTFAMKLSKAKRKKFEKICTPVVA